MNSKMLVAIFVGIVLCFDFGAAHLFGGYVKSTDPDLVREVKNYKRPWEEYHPSENKETGWENISNIKLFYKTLKHK